MDTPADLGMCQIVGSHQWPQHNGRMVYAIGFSFMQSDNGLEPLYQTDPPLMSEKGAIIWQRKHLRPFGKFDPAEKLWVPSIVVPRDQTLATR